MGSKTKTPTGGNQTNNQTPAEKIRDNFLQFTNTRPNTKSDSMIIAYQPDGPDLDRTTEINYGFDRTMSELLANARSGKNVGPPSQTMPPVMFEGPPSQTMPPVFISPQASPNKLFRQSELDTLETVQLPPSVRDEQVPLPGLDIRRFPLPSTPPPNIFKELPPPMYGTKEESQSNINFLPFMLPFPSGIGSLFRDYLLNQQEDS